MKKGLLVVVSGPAGSGKGTVNAHLLKRDDFVYSVSATTRAPRPGEVDGVHYHFLSVDEFKQRLDRGEMIEHTQYCGNFYGTPKKEAEEVLASGRNLILEIEVEGAHNVKAKYPEAVLILLLPPSYSVQEKRLRGRATETEEKILERLAAARHEVTFANDYDYIVYNYDDKDAEAAEQILHIVMAEKAAISRNPDVADLYLKG